MDTIEAAPAFNTFMLDVGNGHQIYVEESGNPDGLPIINFHGGPGSYSKPKHRARFDLNKFRLIMFDQRNAGLSKPHAINDITSLKHHSPTHHVEDAEAIRKHLGLDKWHVCGSSWGSTMALLYAVTYPEHVSSLTLRALFLGQAEDWGWLAEGSKIFCPPAYEAAQNLFPHLAGIGLIKALTQKILTAPRHEALHIAGILANLEGGLEILAERSAEPSPPRPEDEALNGSILYAHIITNHLLEDGWATSESAQSALRHIPTTVIHGNCDASCPLKSAYDLKKAHPHIQLFIAQNSGHGVDLDGEYTRQFNEALATIR